MHPFVCVHSMFVMPGKNGLVVDLGLLVFSWSCLVDTSHKWLCAVDRRGLKGIRGHLCWDCHGLSQKGQRRCSLDSLDLPTVQHVCLYHQIGPTFCIVGRSRLPGPDKVP